MTQLLGFLGDLNENIRKGFSVVAACSDNWRCTMCSCLTSHEVRLSKLECNLAAMNTTIQTAQSLSSRAQAEYGQINSIIAQHESIIPRLNQVSSQKV